MSKKETKTLKRKNKVDQESPIKPKRRKARIIDSDSEDDDVVIVETKPPNTRRKKTEKPSIKQEENVSDDDDVICLDAQSVKKEVKTERKPLNLLPIKKEAKNIKSELLQYPSQSIKPEKKHPIKEEDIKPVWSDYELLSEQKCLDVSVAKSLVKLFENGNTIPFIARYRRDVVGNLSPEMLRDIKESFEEICHLKAKIKTVAKTVEKSEMWSEDLKKSITCSRSVEELEHIYAPFKPGGKRTLAERAKELGLEEAALSLLNNTCPVNLLTLVQPSKKELSKLDLVEKGVIHIIATVIARDTEMLNFLRKLRKEVRFEIQTKKSATKSEKTEKKPDKNKKVDESKYASYFDFKIPLAYIKPHQVLAINRGESQKVLSVKVVVPDYMFHRFSNLCTNKWMVNARSFSDDRKRILTEAIQDSYNRLVQPLVVREIRAELKQKAEKASNEVFSTNLKHLLLMPPLKGKIIMGIDPGYSHGCKIAIVSTTGGLLDHGIIYPHSSSDKGESFLKMLLLKHSCDLVALGNGTACRETERWLSDLIRKGFFHPLNVTYTIVDESGASIYSCSPEAKKEFSDLDPNIISAVSLARRVQEPLAELVKVEPQHLGVGMYQHDLKKKQLEESLNEVVSECVSFVGVDLNTASQCLLRRIAGLTDKRATQIIEHRQKHGPFTHRKQLTEIKGIGPKAFEQCAGFLRVGPTDAKEAIDFYKKPNTTKLDRTYIHPESYDAAKKIIRKLKLNEKDIGDANFINTVENEKSKLDIVKLGDELGCSPGTVQMILDSLSMPLNHDLRSEIKQTVLFKKGVVNINDIKVGDVLTGRVGNVTHFGCFVDIGVGRDGLIHSSAMNGFDLQIGSRVEVKVTNIEVSRNRIGLSALRVL